jgi:hypothetical protein
MYYTLSTQPASQLVSRLRVCNESGVQRVAVVSGRCVAAHIGHIAPYKTRSSLKNYSPSFLRYKTDSIENEKIRGNTHIHRHQGDLISFLTKLRGGRFIQTDSKVIS